MTIDLNNLPDEILFLANNEFYEFIKTCLGDDEMLLLKIQSIKSIRALLNVPDVLAVINIKCKELVDIKNRICFIDENNNNRFVVKSGIKGGIDDLLSVLKEKQSEYIKRTKRLKTSSRSSKNNYTSTGTHMLNSSNTVSDDLTVVPTAASGTSSLDSVNSVFTPPIPTTVSYSMSINDYEDLISSSIEKFSLSTLGNITLRNKDDYTIFLSVLDKNVDAYIKCKCNSSIKINHRSNTNSFQLSQFFKHLKNSCYLITKKKQQINSISREMNNSLNGSSQDDILESEGLDDNDLASANLSDLSETETNNSVVKKKRSLSHSTSSRITKRSKI
ncbi:unnamed protein product [Adineta ricciae]|uniref:Uncharacterized protein n=1 Tax=Adineta ricciae TaxID=249248 RepID=A0A816DBD3_ADIRI|nr:unnamed protein product [Adineta ricciae]